MTAWRVAVVVAAFLALAGHSSCDTPLSPSRSCADCTPAPAAGSVSALQGVIRELQNAIRSVGAAAGEGATGHLGTVEEAEIWLSDVRRRFPAWCPDLPATTCMTQLARRIDTLEDEVDDLEGQIATAGGTTADHRAWACSEIRAGTLSARGASADPLIESVSVRVDVDGDPPRRTSHVLAPGGSDTEAGVTVTWSSWRVDRYVWDRQVRDGAGELLGCGGGW